MAKHKRQHKNSPRTRNAVTPQPQLPAGLSAPIGLRVGLPIVVAAAAFCAFLPALDAEFVNWDDDKVIVSNARIRGLTGENIQWMFSEAKMGHYQPLTWLSYAVDHAIGEGRFDSLDEASQARYQSGLDPRIFHLTNLILHAGVAVFFYLLALCLFRIVLPPPAEQPDWAAPLAAALAALLFACHPLRVETVAWATERRDVLAAFFLLPCLWCYVGYVRADGPGRVKVVLYVAAVVLLPISLLAKAWGITLPAVMLVLDVYPLRRIGGEAGWFSRGAIRAYVDKLPFAISAVYFAVRAKAAQGSALDTMKSLDEWGVADRIAQAFYGLFFYGAKTIVPTGLAPLVPIPVDNNPIAPRYLLAAAAVVVLAVVLLLRRRRWPAGLVLAVCYAGMLSPVLGIAQSGPQLVADRYSYLACLPWVLAGGGGVLWLARRRNCVPWAKPGLPAAAGAALAIVILFGVLTWRQTKVWQTSRTLWTHAVKVDPECVLARSNLGMLERQAGNLDAAFTHYEAALGVDPENYILLNNYANALRKAGRLPDAIATIRRAVELQPKHPDLRYTLASMLRDAGDFDEAIGELRRCVRMKPSNPKYHRGLGKIFFKRRDWAAAEMHYRKTLELETRLDPRGPGVIDALNWLGRIAFATGRQRDAADRFQQILDIDPGHGNAREWLQRVGQAP